jgi:hypothetical protein
MCWLGLQEEMTDSGITIDDNIRNEMIEEWLNGKIETLDFLWVIKVATDKFPVK